jgi:hypothetical protein
VVTLDTQFEEFNKALTGDKKFSGSEIMNEYLPIIFDVVCVVCFFLNLVPPKINQYELNV